MVIELLLMQLIGEACDAMFALYEVSTPLRYFYHLFNFELLFKPPRESLDCSEFTAFHVFVNGIKLRRPSRL